MDLMKTGRFSVAEARLTLALEDVPPQQLADLAGELREYFRTHPAYDYKQIQLLGSVMSAWTSADPESALAFAKQSPSKQFRSFAHSSIFSVLAEMNPEDAIARARELETTSERSSALGTAGWALARKDPKEAMRLFGEMKEIPDHMRMMYLEELARVAPDEAVAALSKVSPTRRGNFWNSDGIFGAWAADDPQAVLAWAQTATDLDMKNSAMKAVCRRMAVDDPAAAMQQVDKLPAHLRSELIGAVMESWADRDPTAALAAAGAIDKPAERERAMAAIINRFDWSDPSEASKVVLAMPKGNARNSALENLAYGINWQSPADRDAILAQFEGVEHSKLAAKVAGSMVSEDAAAAMKLFSEIPPTQRGEDDFNTFMWSLSRHDPAEALKFASTLPSASERSQAVRNAISEMTRLSPQEAARTMNGMDDPKDRQQALVALSESWGSMDADAALRWAESLSGDEQTTALASILPERAKNTPSVAAQRLQTLLENPGAGSASALQSATGSLATEWAGRDPLAASAWVAGLPAGAAAESGAGSLIQNWSTHDPVAAADWISTLPDGGMKDAAIQPLIESIRQNDPESAFTWGLSIRDSAKRAAVMEETLKNWNLNDAAAARAAVQQAGLSETERGNYEKLLR